MTTFHAAEFAKTLQQLGYVSSRESSYDWLGAEPQVVPILNAITKVFTSSCVLSPEEASFASLNNTSFPSTADPLFDVKHVLASTPKQQSVEIERKSNLDAAKKHLMLLRKQKAVLQDCLNRQQQNSPIKSVTKSSHSSVPDSKENTTSLQRLSLKTDLTKRHLQKASVCSEEFGNLMRAYLSIEENNLTDLKRVIDTKLNEIANKANTKDSTKLSNVQSLLKSYAEVQAKKWATESALVRLSTIRCSLQKNEMKSMEMSMTSSTSILEDLKYQSKDLFAIKYDEVMRNNFNSITKQVREYNNQRNRETQLIIVSSMLRNVHDLSYQRLRMSQAKHFLNTLSLTWKRAVNKEISASKPCHLPHTTTISLKTNDDTYATNSNDATKSSYDPMVEILTDSKEVQGFSLLVKKHTSEMDSYIRTSGLHCHRNLVSNVHYPRLVKDFNEVVESNTAVLNAILRSKSSMSSYSSQSSKNSRKHSFYPSSTSSEALD